MVKKVIRYLKNNIHHLKEPLLNANGIVSIITSMRKKISQQFCGLQLAQFKNSRVMEETTNLNTNNNKISSINQLKANLHQHINSKSSLSIVINKVKINIRVSSNQTIKMSTTLLDKEWSLGKIQVQHLA